MEFSQQRFNAALQVVRSCDRAFSSDVFSVELHVFEAVSSTNLTAWELLSQGALPGTAVMALTQTAGRGQWGRQWVSAPGGLYLSVILTPDLAVEASAQLTLCTVWGIATALRTLPGRLSGVETQLPVQIKWLNDLVVNGRKLGGILTETRIHQGRITKAVVGVGINWSNPVPEPGVNLRSLLEVQPVPLIESLEMLAAITLHGLLSGYQRWQTLGIDPLLPEYFDLLACRDRPLQLDGGLGTIVGIAPTGELRVQVRSPEVAAPLGNPASSFNEMLLKPGTISLGYCPDSIHHNS